MQEGDDDPHLDLEGEREMQAYNLIKNHKFVHMLAYHPDLLEKIGMDTEFATICKAIGWENIAPIEEKGSRLLTIQFLCSLQEVEGGLLSIFLRKNIILHGEISALT